MSFSGLIALMFWVGCHGCLEYVRGPNRQRAKEGESVTFQCSFRQSGSRNNYEGITWRRGNDLLSNGARHVISNMSKKDVGEKTVSTLTIFNVSRTDNNVYYKCPLSNPCQNSRSVKQAKLTVYFFDTNSPLECPLPPEPGNRNDQLSFRISLPDSFPGTQVQTSSNIGLPLLSYSHDHAGDLSVNVILHERLHNVNITFKVTNTHASNESLSCTIGPFKVNSKPVIIMTSSSSFDLGFVHEAMVNCTVLRAFPPPHTFSLDCQPGEIAYGCRIGQGVGSAKLSLNVQRVNSSVNHAVSVSCFAANDIGESEVSTDIPIREVRNVTHLVSSASLKTPRPQPNTTQHVILSLETYCTGSFVTCSLANDRRDIYFNWYINGSRALPSQYQNASFLDVSAFSSGTLVACEALVDGALERAYGELSSDTLSRGRDRTLYQSVTSTSSPRYLNHTFRKSTDETSTVSPMILKSEGNTLAKLRSVLARAHVWIIIISILAGIFFVVVVLVKYYPKFCEILREIQKKKKQGIDKCQDMERNVHDEIYHEIVDDNSPPTFVSPLPREENDYECESSEASPSRLNSFGTAVNYFSTNEPM